MVIKKGLFVPSVLIGRKTRKRKPWTLSFIEEAWICRKGAIFQNFSVKRSKARGKRESESRARGRVKRKPQKNTCTPMLTKIEKTRKTFWKWWIARQVMIRIKILLKMSQPLKKKEIRSQGPFPFFNNKMEHPHVKCSLLFLIVLVASKLAPTKLLGYPKVVWQVTNTT